MHYLIDFIPIIVFFVVYKFYDIFWATAAGMVLSLLQVFWKRFTLKKFEPVSIGTFAAITILGGATLIFQDPIFVKWKPTVVYWLLALAFLVTPWINGETLTQKLFHKMVQLARKHWVRLNYAWVIFLILMGILNLYVAYNYSTDTWVYFKVFGTLIITMIFIVGQVMYMAKHRQSGLHLDA